MLFRPVQFMPHGHPLRPARLRIDVLVVHVVTIVHTAALFNLEVLSQRSDHAFELG